MSRPQPRSGERGFALVLFAVVLVVLMIFAAFAVDLGLVYNERRSDQNAADAAATSGAVQLLRRASVQTSVTEMVESVNTNLEITVPTADWIACTDSGALANTAAELSLTPATGCISFNSSFTALRVRVPDQTVETAFGQFAGIDEYTTSAFAEVSLEPAGGGALPFVVLATAGNGDQICLRTDGTGGEEPPDQLEQPPYSDRSLDPCNEDSFDTHEGGRGTIKPYFYEGCSRPTGNQSIISAIMGGMDHPLGVFDPPAALGPGDDADFYDLPANGARLDGGPSGTCQQVLPNTVDVDTGLTAGLLTCALLAATCNAGGAATDGQPGRLRESGSGGSFAGQPVDDTALWEHFITIPSSAPNSCDDAATGGLEFYLRRAALQDCLASWTPGSGILFDEAIAANPRFGFVPRIAERGLCNTQPAEGDPCAGQPLDNVHVNAFAPVYIDGIYEDGGPTGTECDPDNPSTGETEWIIHYPGKGLDCGTSQVERISGIVVPCGALPPSVCDPDNDDFPGVEGIIRVRLSR